VVDVDSLVLIERLDELMAEAKPIPFTREARVDRDEVYKILDRMRTTLPVEFERARWTGREDSQEDAVETQLRQLGASIAELRRAQRAQTEHGSGPPLTAAAAEQVREIVEAAEHTAGQLVEEASTEAARMRAEAARGLKEARDESERLHREARARASSDAADYLRNVEEATQKMLERAAAADSEINGMLARLRGSGGSVIEDLEAIMAGLSQIEIRRTEAPHLGERQAPAKPGAESGKGVAKAATPAPTRTSTPAPSSATPSTATAPAAVPPRPPAPAPVARRPARTPVEGLQEPPEAPDIRPRSNSTPAKRTVAEATPQRTAAATVQPRPGTTSAQRPGAAPPREQAPASRRGPQEPPVAPEGTERKPLRPPDPPANEPSPPSAA
jgi:hypothetical protein